MVVAEECGETQREVVSQMALGIAWMVGEGATDHLRKGRVGEECRREREIGLGVRSQP